MGSNAKNNFVVFLDVDGVLNTRTTCVHTPSGVYVGVDEARLVILSKAMQEAGADGVVLTTTWKTMREDDEDYIYLVESLNNHEIRILGKTEENYFSEREEGILRYLEMHSEIEEFVILDDLHFGFDDYRNLWESFIDTRGKGIENSVFASKTPSVSAILFLDAIHKYS